MTRSRLGWRALDAVGIPLAYAAAAVLLGVAMPRLEARLFPDLSTAVTTGAAMSMLSAIASGMLPLTGLVFSLAFVMVQFSATAYSPRLVSWFAGSRMMTHSLGVFTASFLYALAALAWVDRGGSGHVPVITVWIAIALLMVSIVFFMLLVERLSSLQISRVLAYAGDQGRAVIERDYAPIREGAGATPAGDLPGVSQVLHHQGAPAVVQAVDVRGLVALASQEGRAVGLAWAVGDTVMDGMPLLRVHGAGSALDEDRLRRLVKLGADRTFEQDPKYALRLVVDIAIKALSPAVNDPTTAVQALDQVEDLLLRLGRARLGIGVICDGGGTPRVVMPVPGWHDFLLLALDEIRGYGAGSVQVMRRMKALIQNLRALLPAERHAALSDWEQRLEGTIERTFENELEKQEASVADRQGLGIGEDAPTAPKSRSDAREEAGGA